MNGFYATFNNIRTTLAGPPCRANVLAAPANLNQAYQQGAKWAASQYFGEVAVGYRHGTGDVSGGHVPLWQRAGKTLRRVLDNPIPPDAGEVTEPCLCAKAEGACLVVGAMTSETDAGCACACHDENGVTFWDDPAFWDDTNHAGSDRPMVITAVDEFAALVPADPAFEATGGAA